MVEIKFWIFLLKKNIQINDEKCKLCFGLCSLVIEIDQICSNRREVPGPIFYKASPTWKNVLYVSVFCISVMFLLLFQKISENCWAEGTGESLSQFELRRWLWCDAGPVEGMRQFGCCVWRVSCVLRLWEQVWIGPCCYILIFVHCALCRNATEFCQCGGVQHLLISLSQVSLESSTDKRVQL